MVFTGRAERSPIEGGIARVRFGQRPAHLGLGPARLVGVGVAEGPFEVLGQLFLGEDPVGLVLACFGVDGLIGDPKDNAELKKLMVDEQGVFLVSIHDE